MVNVEAISNGLEEKKKELYDAVRSVDLKRRPYLGAVKKVADDLNVTPAAIHYHIRKRNIDILVRLLIEIRSRVHKEMESLKRLSAGISN